MSFNSGGQNLTQLSCKKYQVLILDYEMFYAEYIESKCASVTKVLWITRIVIEESWGLKLAIMLLTYKSILRPTLTCAFLIWGKE